MEFIEPLAAYEKPDSPGRMVKAYVERPEAQALWADPMDIAAAMVQIASRGQRIPIRVPLGPDSWGMVKAEADKISAEMDELKDLSCGVGNPEQLASLSFLNSSKKD